MKRIFKSLLSLIITCSVFGAAEDDEKGVSVMEGDSVTLNPDLTQIQGIFVIEWRFRDESKAFAKIVGNKISYPPVERFRDRVQLNQTGALTIRNMRTKHSGLYEVEINHKSGTNYMKFFVSVCVYEAPFVIGAGEAEHKSVSVTEGDPVTLQTDLTELRGDELIVWRFGGKGKLIAKEDRENKNPTSYDPDERFRDRLKVDHQTGSLTITHTTTEHTGLYAVKISSNRQTSHKIFTLTVSDPGLAPCVKAGIGGVLLLLMFSLGATAVILYHRRVEELKGKIVT